MSRVSNVSARHRCRPAAPAVAPDEGLDLAEAAEEDGLLADVVAMAGGAVGQDAIARLEVRLPVQHGAEKQLEGGLHCSSHNADQGTC